MAKSLKSNLWQKKKKNDTKGYRKYVTGNYNDEIREHATLVTGRCTLNDFITANFPQNQVMLLYYPPKSMCYERKNIPP